MGATDAFLDIADNGTITVRMYMSTGRAVTETANVSRLEFAHGKGYWIARGQHQQAAFIVAVQKDKAEFCSSLWAPAVALKSIDCCAEGCDKVGSRFELGGFDDLPLKIPDDRVAGGGGLVEEMGMAAGHGEQFAPALAFASIQ